MIFSKQKQQTIGKHFILSNSEKEKTTRSINKVIGQLETIKRDVMNDEACDESLNQILAVRGGVESVGRELVGKGILDCLGSYSKDELEIIIKNLFKLS